jgi:hypothetical protein
LETEGAETRRRIQEATRNEMNKFIMVFLLLCLVGGIWLPIRKRLGNVMLAMSVGLILFFLLYPYKL